MSGMEVVHVATDQHGNIDLESLKSVCGNDIAGLMLTNPNTLGLFDEHICEVTGLVHKAGGLMYGDGANFNALMGIVKPQREIVKMICAQPLREMALHGVHNYCCGGGSGFAIMNSLNFADWRKNVSSRSPGSDFSMTRVSL